MQSAERAIFMDTHQDHAATVSTRNLSMGLIPHTHGYFPFTLKACAMVMSLGWMCLWYGSPHTQIVLYGMYTAAELVAC